MYALEWLLINLNTIHFQANFFIFILKNDFQQKKKLKN